MGGHLCGPCTDPNTLFKSIRIFCNIEGTKCHKKDRIELH